MTTTDDFNNLNSNEPGTSITRELVAFSMPLILSGLLQQLYSWVDAFIVGNIVGEGALDLKAVLARFKELDTVRSAVLEYEGKDAVEAYIRQRAGGGA